MMQTIKAPGDVVAKVVETGQRLLRQAIGEFVDKFEHAFNEAQEDALEKAEAHARMLKGKILLQLPDPSKVKGAWLVILHFFCVQMIPFVVLWASNYFIIYKVIFQDYQRLAPKGSNPFNTSNWTNRTNITPGAALLASATQTLSSFTGSFESAAGSLNLQLNTSALTAGLTNRLQVSAGGLVNITGPEWYMHELMWAQYRDAAYRTNLGFGYLLPVQVSLPFLAHMIVMGPFFFYALRYIWSFFKNLCRRRPFVPVEHQLIEDALYGKPDVDLGMSAHLAWCKKYEGASPIWNVGSQCAKCKGLAFVEAPKCNFEGCENACAYMCTVEDCTRLCYKHHNAKEGKARRCWWQREARSECAQGHNLKHLPCAMDRCTSERAYVCTVGECGYGLCSDHYKAKPPEDVEVIKEKGLPGRPRPGPRRKLAATGNAPPSGMTGTAPSGPAPAVAEIPPSAGDPRPPDVQVPDWWPEWCRLAFNTQAIEVYIEDEESGGGRWVSAQPKSVEKDESGSPFVLVEYQWDSDRYVEGVGPQHIRKRDETMTLAEMLASTQVQPSALTEAVKVEAAQNVETAPQTVTLETAENIATAYQILDGRLGTQWVSRKRTHQMIIIDLGQQCLITKVRVQWYADRGKYTDLRVDIALSHDEFVDPEVHTERKWVPRCSKTNGWSEMKGFGELCQFVRLSFFQLSSCPPYRPPDRRKDGEEDVHFGLRQLQLIGNALEKPQVCCKGKDKHILEQDGFCDSEFVCSNNKCKSKNTSGMDMWVCKKCPQPGATKYCEACYASLQEKMMRRKKTNVFTRCCSIFGAKSHKKETKSYPANWWMIGHANYLFWTARANRNFHLTNLLLSFWMIAVGILAIVFFASYHGTSILGLSNTMTPTFLVQLMLFELLMVISALMNDLIKAPSKNVSLSDNDDPFSFHRRVKRSWKWKHKVVKEGKEEEVTTLIPGHDGPVFLRKTCEWNFKRTWKEIWFMDNGSFLDQVIGRILNSHSEADVRQLLVPTGLKEMDDQIVKEILAAYGYRLRWFPDCKVEEDQWKNYFSGPRYHLDNPAPDGHISKVERYLGMALSSIIKVLQNPTFLPNLLRGDTRGLIDILMPAEVQMKVRQAVDSIKLAMVQLRDESGHIGLTADMAAEMEKKVKDAVKAAMESDLALLLGINGADGKQGPQDKLGPLASSVLIALLPDGTYDTLRKELESAVNGSASAAPPRRCKDIQCDKCNDIMKLMDEARVVPRRSTFALEPDKTCPCTVAGCANPAKFSCEKRCALVCSTHLPLQPAGAKEKDSIRALVKKVASTMGMVLKAGSLLSMLPGAGNSSTSGPFSGLAEHLEGRNGSSCRLCELEEEIREVIHEIKRASEDKNHPDHNTSPDTLLERKVVQTVATMCFPIISKDLQEKVIDALCACLDASKEKERLETAAQAKEMVKTLLTDPKHGGNIVLRCCRWLYSCVPSLIGKQLEEKGLEAAVPKVLKAFEEALRRADKERRIRSGEGSSPGPENQKWKEMWGKLSHHMQQKVIETMLSEMFRGFGSVNVALVEEEAVDAIKRALQPSSQAVNFFSWLPFLGGLDPNSPAAIEAKVILAIVEAMAGRAGLPKDVIKAVEQAVEDAKSFAQMALAIQKAVEDAANCGKRMAAEARVNVEQGVEAAKSDLREEVASFLESVEKARGTLQAAMTSVANMQRAVVDQAKGANPSAVTVSAAEIRTCVEEAKGKVQKAITEMMKQMRHDISACLRSIQSPARATAASIASGVNDAGGQLKAAASACATPTSANIQRALDDVAGAQQVATATLATVADAAGSLQKAIKKMVKDMQKAVSDANGRLVEIQAMVEETERKVLGARGHQLEEVWARMQTALQDLTGEAVSGQSGLTVASTQRAVQAACGEALGTELNMDDVASSAQRLAAGAVEDFSAQRLAAGAVEDFSAQRLAAAAVEDFSVDEASHALRAAIQSGDVSLEDALGKTMKKVFLMIIEANIHKVEEELQKALENLLDKSFGILSWILFSVLKCWPSLRTGLEKGQEIVKEQLLRSVVPKAIRAILEVINPDTAPKLPSNGSEETGDVAAAASLAERTLGEALGGPVLDELNQAVRGVRSAFKFDLQNVALMVLKATLGILGQDGMPAELEREVSRAVLLVQCVQLNGTDLEHMKQRLEKMAADPLADPLVRQQLEAKMAAMPQKYEEMKKQLAKSVATKVCRALVMCQESLKQLPGLAFGPSPEQLKELHKVVELEVLETLKAMEGAREGFSARPIHLEQQVLLKIAENLFAGAVKDAARGWLLKAKDWALDFILARSQGPVGTLPPSLALKVRQKVQDTLNTLDSLDVKEEDKVYTGKGYSFFKLCRRCRQGAEVAEFRDDTPLAMAIEVVELLDEVFAKVPVDTATTDFISKELPVFHAVHDGLPDVIAKHVKWEIAASVEGCEDPEVLEEQVLSAVTRELFHFQATCRRCEYCQKPLAMYKETLQGPRQPCVMPGCSGRASFACPGVPRTDGISEKAGCAFRLCEKHFQEQSTWSCLWRHSLRFLNFVYCLLCPLFFCLCGRIGLQLKVHPEPGQEDDIKSVKKSEARPKSCGGQTASCHGVVPDGTSPV